MLRRRLAAICAVFELLTGCSSGTPAAKDREPLDSSTPPPPSDTPDIETDREVYHATVDTDFVRLTVGLRYWNVGPDTTFIPGCRGPRAPVLDKWEEDQWVTVYYPIEPACGGPLSVIPPGTSLNYTFHVMGGRPGRNISAEFTARSVPGYYRVVWQVYTARETRAPHTTKRAVSRIFRVAVQ